MMMMAVAQQEQAGPQPLIVLEPLTQPLLPREGPFLSRALSAAGLSASLQSLRLLASSFGNDHAEVDRALEAALRLPNAQERLQCLVKSLVCDHLVDFACVSLVCSGQGFAVGAIYGRGSEQFPEPLSMPRRLSQTGIEQRPPFSLYSAGRAFCVEGSGWSVADVVVSERPWYWSFDTPQDTLRAGQPWEAGCLQRAGMQSMIALPCEHLDNVVGTLLLGSTSKQWDQTLLLRLQQLVYRMTPFVVQAVQDHHAPLTTKPLRRFKSRSQLASGCLDELVCLDKILAKRLAAPAGSSKIQKDHDHHGKAPALSAPGCHSLPEYRALGDVQLLTTPGGNLPDLSSLRSSAISLPSTTAVHTTIGAEVAQQMAMHKAHGQMSSSRRSGHRSGQRCSPLGPPDGMTEDMISRLAGSAAYVAARASMDEQTARQAHNKHNPDHYMLTDSEQQGGWLASATDYGPMGAMDFMLHQHSPQAHMMNNREQRLPSRPSLGGPSQNPSQGGYSLDLGSSNAYGWEMASTRDLDLHLQHQQCYSTKDLSLLTEQRYSNERRISGSTSSRVPSRQSQGSRAAQRADAAPRAAPGSVLPDSVALSLAASSSLYSSPPPPPTGEGHSSTTPAPAGQTANSHMHRILE